MDCPLDMTARADALDFTPSPRQEKSKKALSDSPTRPMTMGASSTYNRLMISMGSQKGAATSVDVIVPVSYSSAGNG